MKCTCKFNFLLKVFISYTLFLHSLYIPIFVLCLCHLRQSKTNYTIIKSSIYPVCVYKTEKATWYWLVVDGSIIPTWFQLITNSREEQMLVYVNNSSPYGPNKQYTLNSTNFINVINTRGLFYTRMWTFFSPSSSHNNRATNML